MFIDIDCSQMKKYNQNAFGDYFVSKRYPDEARLIAVLSDGLGSGIKANILSCMTATMLLRFIENQQIPIRQAAEIIMNSLPVCKVRRISYSTFSGIDVNDDGYAKIVEEGNPQFLWIRDNEIMEPSYETIQSKTFKNRKLKIYRIQLKLGDRLIFCSDGVTQAGLGGGRLKLGLRRDGLIVLVKDKLNEHPDISSSELSQYIVNQARNIETDRQPKDDISACVLYFREPREALVFTGPPYHQQKDKEYAEMFANFKGKKAIAGGTTANLISRELNRPITMDTTISIGKLPACSYMEGVDLVTEGILTLTKTLEYLENGTMDIDNAAGKLVKFLLDSDCINFMVGAKLNQAHYDPALPIEIEIRKNIIKKIAGVLQDKYFKKVTIQYM
ncbi:TPA: SpoIIE family protein phosphatase [Candidatus Scatousia excrementigallinarum]|uniref:SpoIIE family protein phosphatase n=1 Tax=Candidatus Scatousia excrementigallinarum TaxID=2840935 RepID=A0A9D1EZB6_9BACT|nr:SpoIIE family protein phosphatase [Candidatus Scatousia excrementigallinarum]